MPILVRCWIIVLAAMLVTACGGADQESVPAAVPLLTLGHVGHDHQIALGVAALEPEKMRQQCGIHLQELKPREVYRMMEGERPIAELHVKKVGGGSKMPEAMSRGELDVGLGGIAAILFFIDKGTDMKLLCPLNVDGDMLLVQPEFPAATWEEFVAAAKVSPKPLRIGYKEPVAVAKLIFERACAAEGLRCVAAGQGKAGEVELVNLQGEANVVPSLASGAVEGAVVNEPGGSIAVYKKAARIVCQLSELPPEGMWKSHPCCGICATGTAIANHRAVLQRLVKLIRAATEVINADKERAAELAHQWTKQPLEVERSSVPNIVYTVDAGDAYRLGMERWFEMMRERDTFQGVLKELSNADAFARVHDLSFLRSVE
ncbi:MAG: ABC transporter substrate-binding protein [Planctomycetes bacterium]|nr:ABC transporter substrate-binding protein [Planctomycetota bacterium]